MLHNKPLTAITCPVCNGVGEAPNDSFFKYGKRYAKNVVICTTCMGKGWIEPV